MRVFIVIVVVALLANLVRFNNMGLLVMAGLVIAGLVFATVWGMHRDALERRAGR